MDSTHKEAVGRDSTRAKARFDQWRRSRRRREPIPDELWEMAVKAALAHGVPATARRLRLNATSLKQRMQKRGERRPTEKPACFVELPLIGAASVPECILEAEDGAGTKLRIHLKAGATAQAVALGRLLWRGAP